MRRTRVWAWARAGRLNVKSKANKRGTYIRVSGRADHLSWQKKRAGNVLAILFLDKFDWLIISPVT